MYGAKLLWWNLCVVFFFLIPLCDASYLSAKEPGPHKNTEYLSIYKNKTFYRQIFTIEKTKYLGDKINRDLMALIFLYLPFVCSII